MTDSRGNQSPDDMVDLPIQPTGSGVADLKVAYEQMKLPQGTQADDRAVDELGHDRSADTNEVEAHPS